MKIIYGHAAFAWRVSLTRIQQSGTCWLFMAATRLYSAQPVLKPTKIWMHSELIWVFIRKCLFEHWNICMLSLAIISVLVDFDYMMLLLMYVLCIKYFYVLKLGKFLYCLEKTLLSKSDSILIDDLYITFRVKGSWR